MKKITLISCILSLCCCGCSTMEKPQSNPPVQPLPVAPVETRPVTQAEANISIANEVNTKLRVTIKYPQRESAFSSRLATSLADMVVLKQADIVLNEPADIAITLNPEFELKDKTGEYYRILCNGIHVTVASSKKIYATKNIELPNMPRQLGEAKAKNQYLKPAADQIAAFLKNKITDISNKEVAVSILNFRLANTKNTPDTRQVAEQVNRLSGVIAATPGIINYTNVSQDVATATCSFRIVYIRDQFPQGIANVLNHKLNAK